MITDTVVLQDEKRELYYISQLWRNIPKGLEVLQTLKDNPFSQFKRIEAENFGGTIYRFGKTLVVNYPARPRFCRWVLFRIEGQTEKELIDFITDLEDTNSLPTDQMYS